MAKSELFVFDIRDLRKRVESNYHKHKHPNYNTIIIDQFLRTDNEVKNVASFLVNNVLRRDALEPDMFNEMQRLIEANKPITIVIKDRKEVKASFAPTPAERAIMC